MGHLRTAFALAVLASAAAVGVATPAQAAAPDVRDHYHDVFDILAPEPDEPPGSTFCGLVGVPIHGEVDGYFSVQTRGDSEFPHFADRFRNHFVYTNPETGKTFTVDTIGSFRDLHIVDNGDGTLTITNQLAGHQNVYDSNGNLVLTDRGLVREVVLIVHQGTIDPEDDVFKEQLSIAFFGPHGTEGRDFCDDFLEFTA